MNIGKMYLLSKEQFQCLNRPFDTCLWCQSGLSGLPVREKRCKNAQAERLQLVAAHHAEQGRQLLAEAEIMGS